MLLRIVAIVKAAGKEFVVDHGPRLAAALSYYTVFSLVPLLFVVASISGFILDDPTALQDVVAQVTDLAGAEVGDTIESLLVSVRDQRAGTLSIGLLIAAFTASNIFQQVQSVLAAIFHVPESKRRTGAIGWLVRRAIGVVSTFVIATLVFTPIVAVAAIEFLVDLLPDSLGALETLLRLGIAAASLLMLITVSGLTLQALTPVQIPWKAAVRGGATTALTGLTAASLVGIYLSQAAGSGTLGALGGAAILLFFFYLLLIVFVFGAEVTEVYADYLDHGDVVAPSERVHAHPPVLAAGSPEPVVQAKAAKQGLGAFIAGVAVGWAARRQTADGFRDDGDHRERHVAVYRAYTDTRTRHDALYDAGPEAILDERLNQIMTRPGLPGAVLADRSPGAEERLSYLADATQTMRGQAISRMQMLIDAGLARPIDPVASSVLNLALVTLVSSDTFLSTIFDIDVTVEDERDRLVAGVVDILKYGMLPRD